MKTFNLDTEVRMAKMRLIMRLSIDVARHKKEIRRSFERLRLRNYYLQAPRPLELREIPIPSPMQICTLNTIDLRSMEDTATGNIYFMVPKARDPSKSRTAIKLDFNLGDKDGPFHAKP